MALFGEKNNNQNISIFAPDNASIKQRDMHLIKKTLQGNSHAFAQLISFYQNRVRKLGFSFFKNQQDVDDFEQDVFIKVYTKLKTFRGDSMFSTWLTRLAYNTAVNNLKRRDTYCSLSEDIEIVDNNFTPEQDQIRKVTAKAIQECITQLPEKYVTCLDMYFFYDISYNDISEILDIPVNTLKSHIFRAKKIIRQKLIEEKIIEV